MTIYVGSNKIKQIYIGANATVRQVYYGRYLVWEIEATMQSNTPVTKTIYLTPGRYEVYAVGGGGGSAGSGGGGSASSHSNVANPAGGS